MPQFKLFLARFPFMRTEDPDVTDWLLKTVPEMKAHPNVAEVGGKYYDTTPITGGRNEAVEDAKRFGADFILMIDNDMSPDVPYVGAKPFWRRSFDHLLQQQTPSMVGVPYCGPPPHENPYVFYWRNKETGNPNTDISLEMYERAHAEQMAGIQPCAALPTGLILIDMRCFAKIPYPYFDYEWEGDGPACPHCGQREPGPRAIRASTEDVFFSRNASMHGCRLFCDWDAWAGHWKRKKVGKPSLMKRDQVNKAFQDAVLGGRLSNERRVYFKTQDPEALKAMERVGSGVPPPVLVGPKEDWGKVIGDARNSLKDWGSDYEGGHDSA